jgi:type I restriction enzyme S subunit
MIGQTILYKETEFIDSSIGRVPSDWDTRELGDESIASIIAGQSPPSSAYSKENQGLPFLQGKAEFGDIFPSPTIYCSKPIKVAKKDDILLSVRAPVGDVNIAPFECCIGRGLAAVRTKKDRLSHMFLFHYLRLEGKRFEALSTGSTFKAIRMQEIEKLQIPLPPVPEQMAIAEVLGVVDSAIQKIREVIAKTERLKKGLMQKLLTEGIGHKEYKDTPIGKIPAAWQTAKLQEVSKEVIIGNVNPATPFYTTAENGVPYFRSQNVRENNLVPTDTYVKKEFNQIHSKSILRENDVLTIQTGFIGTSCLVPKIDEGSNCHSLLITRTDPQLLDPQFLCHFLNSDAGKKTIMKHNAGWGRDHLLLEDFRKTDIPIPPLAEQDRIANILSTIYQKATLERTEKLKLERIKVCLMDLLLTGKIRVQVD